MGKNLTKTVSWAIVSGIIIAVSAYICGANFESSVMAGITASAAKTPFFSAHEYVFEKIYSYLYEDKKCES